VDRVDRGAVCEKLFKIHNSAFFLGLVDAIMLALGLLWSKTSLLKTANVGDSVMWMEKLSYGVLRVLTPLGPRYLNPSLLQRLYLLWIFRNFETLPVKVLSQRQQRRIDGMCARYGFLSVLERGVMDTPLLGTLEQRPPVAPARAHEQSVSDAVSPFATDV
jgi:hypothetical protein